jgi:ribulose-phosphate 3-epimerase
MILAPSILSADFARLGEQVAAAARGGASLVHVDVMDGHFVPNITMGLPILRSLRKATELPLDVHLMIDSAERYLPAFVDAGASWISLHQEAVTHLQRQVAYLHERGVKAGVALNPSTPIGLLEEILPELDYVLVMSVNPGFGGQKFIAPALDKVRRVRRMIEERGLKAQIEVDGGVDLANIRTVVQAGADILVAGSAVFDHGDPEAAERRLIEAVQCPSAAAATRCASATRRRTRWAWPGMASSSPGSRWAGPTCCAATAAPTGSWRRRGCASR